MRTISNLRSLPQKLIYAILAACLFPVSLLYQGPLGGHDLTRVVQLILLTLCAAFVVLAPNKAPVSLRTALTAFSLLLLSLASILAAQYPWIAAREVTLLLGLIALAYVTTLAVHRLGLNPIGKVMVAAMAIYSTIQFSIYAIALALEGQTNSWGLAIGYENPRFLNHVQSIAIPLLIGMSLNPTISKAWRHLAGLSALIQFTILMALFGRASLVALAGSAGIAWIAFGETGRRFSKRLILVSLLGWLCNWLMFTAVPSLIHATRAAAPAITAEATSDHSRFYLWNLAVEQIIAHPWLGVGPMHLAHFPNIKGAHPHNIYLQVAAEFGLPFSILLLASLLLALLGAVRQVRTMTEPGASVTMGAVAACVAAAIDGLFSGNFVMPNSQLWIAIAAGFACAGTTAICPEQRVGRIILPAPLIRSGGVIVCVAMSMLLAQSLNEVAKDPPHLGVQAQQLSPGDDKLRPRFWRDGWF